jgi:hypothetical protein
MTEKKAKQVVLEVGGETYTLEYNRASIKQMERKGFSVSEVEKKFFTSLDLMLEGALYKNHPKVTDAQIETFINTVYDEYQVQDLMEVLLEMFSDALPEFGGEAKDKKVFKIVR